MGRRPVRRGMEGEPIWAPPPPRPEPAGEEVHLWRATLELPAGAVQQAARVLSDEERARAERIVVDRARDRFVAGRCLLRTVLGSYLRVPAEAVELAYGPHGKPELAPGLDSGRLAFSLAHSHDLALLAVALRRAVGVDVERLRPLSDMAGLVARLFSSAEQAEFAALPPEQRLDGFFRGWTGKEAWLKATSIGLTWPPDWFSVSLTPGLPLCLIEVRGDPEEAGRWGMASFAAAPGYLGALAVEGRDWGVVCYDLAPVGRDPAAL